MSARLPLLAAGFVLVAAMALLAGLAPAASAAPVAAPMVPAAGTACAYRVVLVAPAQVVAGESFLASTEVLAFGAGCHAIVHQYYYYGFATPTYSAPAFTTVLFQPGTYHVAVLVRASFGLALGVATIQVL